MTERAFENVVVELLTSIDASLKILVGHTKARAAAAPKTVATDRDLDGKYGNPELKFMPRDWIGPSYKGRRFSECPPQLLDQLSEMLEYFATQAEEKNEQTHSGKPVAPFRRADAARARGWATRIREGKHQQAAEPTPVTGPDWVDSEEVGW